MGQFDRQAQSRPKHGPPSVSSASKAPARPSSSRPVERNSGLTKKAAPRRPQPPSTPQAPAPSLQKTFLPVELQQLILDIFRVTFPASQDFEALKPLLGQINDASVQGDFETAFGTDEFREGYAIRWSPSRALMYSDVLAQICVEHGGSPWAKQFLGDDTDVPAKVVCLGGGAAELMALAGLLRYRREEAAGKPSAASSLSLTAVINLHLVDAADWSGIVSKLNTALTTRPELSKYASASARAQNASLLSPQALATEFTKTDVLKLTGEELASIMRSDVTLITLLFTLNDLYRTSIPRATSLMRKLSALAPKGCLLLVIDSHEATATAVGPNDSQEKAYPMDWLLDKALMPNQGTAGEESAPPPIWEKLVDDTNRLCKFPEKGLTYPAGLENLKVQVHLFMRL
ncbi:hypothetical protein KJ359_006684 [Pestalotiopsis sp. 9143b]|nr:hypothetical protein KJ359_006684 [Pestalotiopsis sp. 9143b]